MLTLNIPSFIGPYRNTKRDPKNKPTVSNLWVFIPKWETDLSIYQKKKKAKPTKSHFSIYFQLIKYIQSLLKQANTIQLQKTV